MQAWSTWIGAVGEPRMAGYVPTVQLLTAPGELAAFVGAHASF